MIRWPILLPFVAAACNAPTADPQANVAAPANAYAARIAALPVGQRNGVLIRALRDADRDCQQVTESSVAGEIEGKPAWAATCDGRTQWVVAFGGDGVATIIGADAIAH